MIQQGDSINLLKSLPSDSIDAIITDPPYGISFMNKDWDKFNEITDIHDQGAYGKEKGFKTLPRNKPFGMLKFFTPIWKEAIRVLKPGAFAFVMCSPRQDVMAQQILALSEAGFNTGYTSIFWTYASGFPKAQNISKGVDKRGGINISWFGEWLKNWREENHISQREIASLFPSKSGGITGCVANWELGYNLPTPEQFTLICKHFNLPFKKIEEAKREIINKYPMSFGIGGNSKRLGSMKILDIPSTEEAKSLDGSYAGFQPKPAVEPILVVMKPLSEKTYVDQALKNGKGITWLDNGRIPYNSEDDMESSRFGVQTDIRGNNYNTNRPSEGHIYNRNVLSSEIGRFPANLLVSDDVLNDGNITQSGGVGGRPMHGRGEGYGFKPMGINAPEVPTDEGSFSRYFDLDAWYETNVESLPDYVQKVYPFLIVPKASKGEKNKGIEQFDEFTVDDGRHKSIDNPFQRGETLRKNIHPTVKPVKLMSYLVSIATKPNEIVLDPFMGSGTTGVACKILNREFIGFEMKGEYFEIAQERIENIPDSIDSYEVDD